KIRFEIQPTNNTTNKMNKRYKINCKYRTSTTKYFFEYCTLIAHVTKKAANVAMDTPYNSKNGISNRFNPTLTVAPTAVVVKIVFVRFAPWKPADQKSDMALKSAAKSNMPVYFHASL